MKGPDNIQVQLAETYSTRGTAANFYPVRAICTVSAFEAINKAKTEVTLSNSATGDAENLFKLRREVLISILDSSKPLNGRGFFQVNNSIVTSVVGAATTYIVVLMQFGISERSACKCSGNGNGSYDVTNDTMINAASN